MSEPNVLKLLQQLETEGLLTDSSLIGAETALSGHVAPSPWYLRFMVGFGAWLSAFFFIGFFTQIIRSQAAALVLGPLLIVIAIIISRRQHPGDFLNQLALAACLTGQLLVLFGSDIHNNISGNAMLILLMQLLLIPIYANRTYRLISTLLATGAVELLLFDWKLPYGTAVFAGLLGIVSIPLWLKETIFTWQGQDRLVRPVAYGLVVAMFVLLLPSVFSPLLEQHNPLTIQAGNLWLSSLFLGGGLLYLVMLLLREHGQTSTSVPAIVCSASVLLLMWPALNAPGLIGALIVLLLGFRRGNRLLLGMALVFLAVFLSAYYYNLSISLLLKSAALTGSGLILLLLRWALLKQLPQEEASHAG